MFPQSSRPKKYKMRVKTELKAIEEIEFLDRKNNAQSSEIGK